LSDLDAIADHIALDKPLPARALVARVFDHVAQLADHPESGSRLRELRSSRYRQVIEPPCRVIDRLSGDTVVILHVIRSEQRLNRSKLRRSVP
jgi:plasmid stabilization system protein ParE